MGRINLLDCTLRDGGYINNWEFGENAIRQILVKLAKTKIEMIEIGFIKGDEYNPNQTLFPDTDSFCNVIIQKDDEVKYLGMLDMSKPVSVDKIRKRHDGTIDGIRVIFKQNKIDEAYEYCQHIKKMGYDLYVNFVNTDCYTDKEFIEGIEKFNVLNPTGMTIVDTFGMIKRKQFLRLVALADHNMNSDSMLCYHAHNNLQQAFGNAEALVEMNFSRDICIDACVFGMGRGAGNLNLELFAEYMNENHDKKYRISPMLEIMDEFLSGFYKNKFWGYSLPLYLSATTGCHPNYAIYLAEKHTLTEKAFGELLNSISNEDKLVFSQEKADGYYRNYFEHYIDDKEDIGRLSQIFGRKTVLLLAPGKTLMDNKEDILSFLHRHEDIITVSLNFYLPELPSDYIFTSNMRRYRQLPSVTNAKIIATSNIISEVKADFYINYSTYTCSHESILDNAGVMSLKLFSEMSVSKVFVAGMDGYGGDFESNYYNIEYENQQQGNYEVKNACVSFEIKNLMKYMDIEFITPSKYQ